MECRSTSAIVHTRSRRRLGELLHDVDYRLVKWLRSKAQGQRQKLLMSFAHWFEQDWGDLAAATKETNCFACLSPVWRVRAKTEHF